MKVRRGVTTYKFPPVGKLIRAYVDESLRGAPGRLRVLEIVERDTMLKMADGQPGEPKYIALVERALWVWPEPDDDYRIRVRYFQPAIEK